MVTRKPLPENAVVDPRFAPHVNMQGTNDDAPPAPTQQAEAEDSDVDSWERASASAGEEDEEEAEPQSPAREEVTEEGDAATDVHDNGESPSTFPPGVDGDWEDNAIRNTPDPSPSAAGIASPAETNPFRRNMSQSSGQTSVTVPPMATETPPLPPSENLAKLSLNDTTTNPWQPALDEQQKTLAPPTLSTATEQDPAQDIWASQVPSRAASTGPTPSDSQADRFVAPDEAAGWSDDTPEKSSIAVPASFRKSLEGEELEDDSHAWDDVATDVKGKAPLMPGTSPEGARDEDWNMVDEQPTPEPSGNGEPSQAAPQPDEKAPILPLRGDEKAPAPLQRTPIAGKTETYQVKNINWHDAVAADNPRKSPILVQNANGPCPLMALVNALTLTTPVSAEDAVLVNTLKAREQISLDLLLDAVFDELMSERRTAPDHSLPDVTELYSFLKGLHTGMNVNPRFIPTKETETAFKRTSLTHLHPTERGDLIPGTFEDTKEMAFYRIFRVPLIHGWLPSKEEPAYDALKRHAESYEDAQNILFREEELEDKLSNPEGEGLSEEEQGIYQDVLSIKSFLYTAATQLTSWGLEVITKAMRPGSVAILFRNDHFSTLYRHPQTLQIFALVTDAGYAGHQEVVWESLVDVNGEHSEFFSGDFRVVGGLSQSDQYAASGSASTSNGQGEWTTVQGKRGKDKNHSEAHLLSPKEQEDRDLALALQLQEEEDQRHRAEQAQRRRESQLSEQFIEQQAVRRGPVGLRQSGGNNGTGQQPQPAPAPAGRRTTSTGGTTRGGSVNNPGRGGRPGQQQVRPLVPPVLRSQGVNRPSDADVDDAPPSYEDAAKDRPYVPPAGHPSHPDSTPGPLMGTNTPASNTPRLPGSRAPGVAGVAQSPATGGFRRGSSAYRQGVPPTAASGGGRDKDCVVM